MYAQLLSRVWIFVTPWTVACQAPLSMGFSRQEYWSGLPFPPPGDLPDPGIEPVSPAPLASAGRFFLPLAPPGKPLLYQRPHHSLLLTSGYFIHSYCLDGPQRNLSFQSRLRSMVTLLRIYDLTLWSESHGPSSTRGLFSCLFWPTKVYHSAHSSW